MAHLYLCPESDSIYLDVTADAGAPQASREAAPGVWLHIDDGGDVVGIELFGLAERGGLDVMDLDQQPGGDALPELNRFAIAIN